MASLEIEDNASNFVVLLIQGEAARYPVTVYLSAANIRSDGTGALG